MRGRRSRGNLFVGNLPPDFTDERLAEIFDSCGIVLSATIARDPATGRTLRYGFVDIATERAAEAAVAAMKGVSIDGHTLEVSLSKRPAAAKRPPGRSRPAPRPRAEAVPRRLGLGADHLPHDADAEDRPPRLARKTPNFVVERRPLPRRI